jgi:hypothetical protein
MEKLRIKRSREEREAIKEQRDNARYWREQRRKTREARVFYKFNYNREIKVLEFMDKMGVQHLHHGQVSNHNEEVKKRIQILKGKVKELNDIKNEELLGCNYHLIHLEYEPYVWNRLGEGNNYLPLSHLGSNLWRSSDFDTIYDVPLDGTYMFYTYDSGERGLGSFDRISAKKVEEVVSAPGVDPGGFPPTITF